MMVQICPKCGFVTTSYFELCPMDGSRLRFDREFSYLIAEKAISTSKESLKHIITKLKEADRCCVVLKRLGRTNKLEEEMYRTRGLLSLYQRMLEENLKAEEWRRRRTAPRRSTYLK